MRVLLLGDEGAGGARSPRRGPGARAQGVGVALCLCCVERHEGRVLAAWWCSHRPEQAAPGSGAHLSVPLLGQLCASIILGTGCVGEQDVKSCFSGGVEAVRAAECLPVGGSVDECSSATG